MTAAPVSACAPNTREGEGHRLCQTEKSDFTKISKLCGVTGHINKWCKVLRGISPLANSMTRHMDESTGRQGISELAGGRGVSAVTSPLLDDVSYLRLERSPSCAGMTFSGEYSLSFLWGKLGRFVTQCMLCARPRAVSRRRATHAATLH